MRAAAATIRRDPRVKYVEEDVQVSRLQTNDEHRPKQWALDKIRVDEAWAGSDYGQNSRIAIIDVGFQSEPENHPDLYRDPGLYTYSFAFKQSSLEADSRCDSHGTHVAGIASALANNTEGIAGIAPLSGLLLLDVTGNDPDFPDCPIPLSTIIAALDWVAGSESSGPNADVVNMSLGTNNYYKSFHDAVFQAFKQGVTVVAAAGNVATNPVLYPAAFPEVIAVSATGPLDEIASYSSTGPEILVSAPGGNSQVSLLNEDAIYSTFYDGTNHNYIYMQGTSMASPAVAGVAGLIYSLNPQLSPVDVANVLRWSSVDLAPAGWDETFGYGRIDALGAASQARTFKPVKDSYRLTTSAGHDVLLSFDGAFSLPNVPQGKVTFTVQSDDDGNGVFGESGEYSGKLTVDVDASGTMPYLFLPAYRVE
jgi:subtilisin family serine protease